MHQGLDSRAAVGGTRPCNFQRLLLPFLGPQQAENWELVLAPWHWCGVKGSWAAPTLGCHSPVCKGKLRLRALGSTPLGEGTTSPRPGGSGGGLGTWIWSAPTAELAGITVLSPRESQPPSLAASKPSLDAQACASVCCLSLPDRDSQRLHSSQINSREVPGLVICQSEQHSHSSGFQVSGLVGNIWQAGD